MSLVSRDFDNFDSNQYSVYWNEYYYRKKIPWSVIRGGSHDTPFSHSILFFAQLVAGSDF